MHGPVAQLGERSVRIREVESSNLFRSTKKSQKSYGFLTFLLSYQNFLLRRKFWLYVNSWGNPKWKHGMERH
jgi:hypothetical protein